LLAKLSDRLTCSFLTHRLRQHAGSYETGCQPSHSCQRIRRFSAATNPSSYFRCHPLRRRASLGNGMSMLDVDSYWQMIVKGSILVLAVWVDVSMRAGRR
jgi:hypothetical protein